VALVVWLVFHVPGSRTGSGTAIDEARLAHRGSFPATSEDYFHPMDGGANLSLEEIQGRNAWILWSAGNDRFWDWLAGYSGGQFDLLKVVSSYDPDQDPKVSGDRKARLGTIYSFRHKNRIETLGVTNEPCFDQPSEPDPQRYGLWLDVRRLDCIPDPFADQSRFPGVELGARGKTIPLGSLYGAPSGVLGLRLFPNPDFNEAAARRWDAERYYTDPSYYSARDLVRPYRVGMTCAFCHAGLNPANMPLDLNDPLWNNLSSTVGAQFLRMGRVALWAGGEGDFFAQLLNAARAGAIETSLVATDYIFNPRAVQPISQMPARMKLARQWGRETLKGAALNNRQISTYVAGGPLAEFFEEPATVWTPRLGKDAMDSVGILGGVNRAFAELGMFSEELLSHFNPLLGGTSQIPVDLNSGRQNSAYWQATEEMAADVVRFLMAVTPAKPPANPAPAPDRTVLARGRAVFAERCAGCHSSKLPKPPQNDDPADCSGNYLECWNRYQAWTRSQDFLEQMQKIVAADDFLENNYLATDLRVPLPAVGSNACIAVSPNGTAGQIWDQFTSQTYKTLPSAGSIAWFHPMTGEKRQWKLPDGGRGYLRPTSLVGLRNTAPLLNNNSLGRLEAHPDLASRAAAFQEAVEELLWPEKREQDSVLGAKVPGRIDRTTARSTLRLPRRALAGELWRLLDPPIKFLPNFSVPEQVEIGPIPAGTPVALLANLNLMDERAAPLLLRMRREITSEGDFARFVNPLLELSSCPDLVVNRGHYFGTGLDGEPALSDQQKRDLIEFLRLM
jgi:hypothetical protein